MQDQRTVKENQSTERTTNNNKNNNTILNFKKERKKEIEGRKKTKERNSTPENRMVWKVSNADKTNDRMDEVREAKGVFVSKKQSWHKT